jgi:hypothetical protein
MAQPKSVKNHQEKMASLQSLDEQRAQLVRQIEVGQLPLAEEVLTTLVGKPLPEVVDALGEMSHHLTDSLQASLVNLVNQYQALLSTYQNEMTRIRQHPEAKPEVEA